MTELINGVMVTTGILARSVADPSRIALHGFALTRQKRNRRPIRYLPPARSQKWIEP